MSKFSLVYCFFLTVAEWLLIKLFPLGHFARLSYPVSFAVSYGHVIKTDQWDIGGSDLFLPTQSSTCVPFLPLPMDGEYPEADGDHLTAH
jgi:hypothetical protein